MLAAFSKKSNIPIDNIVRFCYNNSAKNKEEQGNVDHGYRIKENLSKYLLLSATEDVYITKNGKIVSKLTNPFRERVEVAKSLFGVLPADIGEEEAREERLNKI